ncbi:unnamed protein product [Adineta ricciae]|uniref:Uncharacterized protein n=1 Tax=Adineta ricciae TaxID=249248 RepID=A0A814MKI0_ADIRI|nr:unnamed protein product [Adineta ricciae]CAF1363481.1 unnamed protein product [Adineta ricciae]
MLEENDYDEIVHDPIVTLRHQKYKTWLYIVLLAVCLYILFYINLVKIQSTTVSVSNITLQYFEQLYVEHHETLSCPCSTIRIPYRNITSNNVTMHSICSSIFIDPKWTEALYFANASQFGVWDFRTTAYSQFELLSSFCSLSNEIISQTLSDIGNNEVVTLYLSTQTQIRVDINKRIENLKNSATSRMMTFLNYLQNTNNKHFFVSALNTNFIILTFGDLNHTSLFGLEVSYLINYTPGEKCSETVVIMNATLNRLLPELMDEGIRSKMVLLPNSTIVNGFFTACTPVEALLQSTLDCLYEIHCLQLLFSYFPKLTQINFNPYNSSLSSEDRTSRSVYEYLNDLFVRNWSTEIDYEKYYLECSPSMCIYSTIERTETIHALTIFISLYGGLVIIFRIVSSLSIDILVKWKCCSKSTHRNSTVEQKNSVSRLVQAIKIFNLFKQINDRTEESIKLQRIITRVYVILLIVSICILCLLTSLHSETRTVAITNSSMAVYQSLEDLYASTLRCPCVKQSIPYGQFLSLSPRFHQICSSGFVHPNWIRVLADDSNALHGSARSHRVYLQFQFLSDLCHLARTTIADAIIRYLSQMFVVSSVMNETEFYKQVNASFNQFRQSTVYNFGLMSDVLQLLMQIDQLYLKSIEILDDFSHNVNLINSVITNDSNFIQLRNFQYQLNGIRNIRSKQMTCVCATTAHCETPIGVYEDVFNSTTNSNTVLFHSIPGWVQRCLAIDSLRFSSLECLYEDSDCFFFFLDTLQITTVHEPLLFDFKPLIYEPSMTRYSRNATVSDLFKQIMIEQWSSSTIYEAFFEFCAPTHCTYSQKIRTQNFLGVMVKLISMIGSIMFSLRIITPQLVKLILRLIVRCKNNKKQQRSQSLGTFVNRLKMTIRKLLKFLAMKLLQLNMYSSRDFGSDIDRETVRCYSRWATRLHFFLYLASCAILIFYMIIRTHNLTKTLDQPTFASYERLQQLYGNKLKCSCSQIASPYSAYVEIQPVFHPICSSTFVSNEWRDNLTNDFAANLSIYAQNDYRRFLSAHIQYLQGLCHLSQQTVHNAINELLISLLVTVELLSNEEFHHRVDTLIKQSETNAPILFSRFLFMIRTVNHGNAFMTTYGTNFRYLALLNSPSWSYAYTEAMIYDDNCSCGLFSNCTTQATFIESSKVIPVQGLKIGCLPSESFRLSTLECFYNQSCLDLLHQFTNSQNLSIPLSTASSRFSLNTTINQLMSCSFTEQWSTNKTYSSYYHQCSPSSCSVT